MGGHLLRRAHLGSATLLAAWVLASGFCPQSARAETVPDRRIPYSAVFQDNSPRRQVAVPVAPGPDETTAAVAQPAGVEERSVYPLPSKQTHEGPAVYSLDIPLRAPDDGSGAGSVVPTVVADDAEYPGPIDPSIQKYIEEYTAPAGLRWLQNALDRGEPFRDFIMTKLQEADMPPELYYLALIESTFVVDSVSRSGAVGLWQFMTNSVGDRMAINKWVDERRDFWKSTEAAIDKLAYNYSVLHDWLLAIAAYNAGLGLISRLVQSTGIHDYWTLLHRGLLTDQSSVYVPRFLAAVAVASFAGRHGLDVDWAPPLVWVRVPVKRQVDIRSLAANAAIPYDLLYIGNAELNTDLTPPGDYLLKVPSRYENAVEAVLNAGTKSVDQ